MGGGGYSSGGWVAVGGSDGRLSRWGETGERPGNAMERLWSKVTHPAHHDIPELWQKIVEALEPLEIEE